MFFSISSLVTEITGQEHVVYQEESTRLYQNVCPLGIGPFDKSSEFDSKPFLKLTLKDVVSLKEGKVETLDGVFEVEVLDPCLFDKKQEKVIEGRSGNNHICMGGYPWKSQAFAKDAPEEEIDVGTVDVGRDETYSKEEAEENLEEAQLNDKNLDQLEKVTFSTVGTNHL